MRSYENARGLFSFLEFLAWGGVLLGIAIIFVSMEAASRSFGGGAGLLAAMPGIAISLFSLIWVAIIQVARAGVDTAELTQQSLKVARDQLEVSKQAISRSEVLQPYLRLINPPRSGWNHKLHNPHLLMCQQPQTRRTLKSLGKLKSQKLSANSYPIKVNPVNLLTANGTLMGSLLNLAKRLLRISMSLGRRYHKNQCQVPIDDPHTDPQPLWGSCVGVYRCTRWHISEHRPAILVCDFIRFCG